jgi:hypothetical protein
LKIHKNCPDGCRGREVLSASALCAVSFDDFTEGASLEIKIPLDRQTERATGGPEFGEDKVAPLFLEDDDVAKETKVVLLGWNLG